jgi:hypothetical protein
MMPRPAVGYCMQKMPNTAKRAPLAPPQRMKTSGIVFFCGVIRVAQCCANPESTPVVRKNDKRWCGLPSKALEYP